MKVTEVKSLFAGSFEGHCQIVPRQTTGWPDGSHNATSPQFKGAQALIRWSGESVVSPVCFA